MSTPRLTEPPHSAGTVNTCDFDDLRAIAALRRRFPFWLHVDGAFGALAAASPAHRHLVDGLAEADSITFDGHKWLNVPYDSAVVLTRHLELQGAVFSSLGPYLPPRVQADTFLHLTPENSQRLRALATWMTLAAYGRSGYAELVERCCALAGWLGEHLAAHPAFELLAPVRLNGVCFTLAGSPTAEQVDAYLAAVKADGTAFLTSTVLRGRPAIRLSVTNWRTRQADVESSWGALQRCLPATD